MKEKLDFKDLGFKLAVINELMYVREVLKPKIDVYKFIEKQRNLSESEAFEVIEKEGYEIIPEMVNYFKNLEITSDMVQDIEELYTDGGDDIYLQIIPFWSGESNVFNIKSAKDIDLLPALRKVTIFYDEDTSILTEFENKGITANWL
ncbi:hypothetical protein [uncultured Tenacibaculum sp.]|uniref:DUF6892 domain-containing protein n=1 Tax=uncultured Tenacibaculum sp. TaxID=174713 RepID=UPI0026339A0F|nr:hypothetical protein [uncultured Tenacibaculum sp.]